MKLDTELLADLQTHEVVVGNIYPAQGGRASPGTKYWLVVSLSQSGAHLLGFDEAGQPVSTASYLKGALRTRPVIGHADLSNLVLKGV